MTGAAELAKRLQLYRSGRAWRGTCPACGYGGGAFVLSVGRTGRPLGWCASCQDRDGIARAIGGDTMPPSTPANMARDAATKTRRGDRALALWRGAAPVAGTPAAIYLARRGLSVLVESKALRFRVDTPHPSSQRLRVPAMIAAVANQSGAIIAVHRTYLNLDGSKANVDPVKASLAATWGGSVHVNDLDPQRPLVVAEGIETAASAGILTGLPAWAAISAGNLAAGLVLPREARSVVIAVDPDEPGERAGRAAALRWSGEGRRVRIARSCGTGDFNDILREASYA
jgi:putative DNA primase/helicase